MHQKKAVSVLNASKLCSFLREHIDVQDVAYQSALKDMESQNWIGKAIINSKAKGANDSW